MIISKKLHGIGKLLFLVVSVKISLSLFKSAGIYEGETWFVFPEEPAQFVLGGIAIYTISRVFRKLFLRIFSVEHANEKEEKKDVT